MRSKLLLWKLELLLEMCHLGQCVGEGWGEEGDFGYMLTH